MQKEVLYVSSKLKHSELWKGLRAGGKFHVVSTWIDGGKIKGSEALNTMWSTYMDEVAQCDRLVLYLEVGDYLKGALIEVGAALLLDRPITVVWAGSLGKLESIVGSWIHMKKVNIIKDICDV